MPARTWFVIAAAGSATRFGGPLPKAYAMVAGRTLLEHSLRALATLPGIAGGVVVLAGGDRRFRRLPARVREGVATARGGATRAESVARGLAALAEASAEDWVLVHDAARPCLQREDLAKLVRACRDEAVGGLLATPVVDTLKRTDEAGRVVATEPRERLWRAQTPQMFRHGPLAWALRDALAAGADPSDEAAAMERQGLRPLLVEGSSLNLKVTRRADLAFARAALAASRTR